MQWTILLASLIAVRSSSNLVKASPSHHVQDWDTDIASIVPKKLHGRFIHLTDLHPDPFYRFNSSEAASCHAQGDHIKGDDKDVNNRAGWWGTSVSDCDAPLTLINATFDYLEEHYKGKVDFVVWTGDNARHDIDAHYPRSLAEIFDLNRYVSEQIHRTFGKVPVVTSFGNNDVFPHNIFFGGPSKITNEFLSIWKRYIPEVHLHSFARGGYYTIDAIPNHLMLISLNTLYFYENNKAVDGCPAPRSSMKGGDDDPGTEHLLWLEQQLLLARARGMQVWLTGHVPATQATWYEECYNRFGELMLAFQDTIVGSLFGHLNIDHFSFIQADDVLPPKKGKKHHKKKKGKKRHHGGNHRWSYSSSSSIHTTVSSAALVSDLLSQYQSLPAAREADQDDYHVVHVNPSVIPTYLPAFRIWEYNTSVEARWRQPPDGSLLSDNTSTTLLLQPGTLEQSWAEDVYQAVGDDEDGEKDEDDGTSMLAQVFTFLRHPLSTAPPPVMQLGRGKRHKGRRRRRRKQPRYPPLTRHTSPDAPSRRNTYLTPLAFTQYMMHLDDVNAFDGYGSQEAQTRGGTRPRPEWVVEYSTKKTNETAAASMEETRLTESSLSYEMEDLTIGRWLELAKRLGSNEHDWKGYRRRMFVSSGADE